VIDALVAQATTKLDEAVAAGRLEQADADTRLTEITERITTAVNDGFPAGRGPGAHHDDGDDEETSDAPAATATTEPGG
jgi:hypothetical protein